MFRTGWQGQMAFGYECAYRRDRRRSEQFYTRLFGAVDLPTKIRARAIVGALRGIRCDSVLDVGAGTGAYAFYVTRDPACHAVAFDIDARLIENIRDIAQRLERDGLVTLCGNEQVLTSLPVAGFGVVLAVEVLQCLPDLQQTLYALHHRLRPGGSLIAHVPIRHDRRPYELHLFDDTRLRRLFTEAGFDGVEIRQTFGRVETMLCAFFSWCVTRRVLLAVFYPLMLAAISLRPRFTKNGTYRLVIAKKAM